MNERVCVRVCASMRMCVRERERVVLGLTRTCARRHPAVNVYISEKKLLTDNEDN